jgi:hypothetical protein
LIGRNGWDIGQRCPLPATPAQPHGHAFHQIRWDGLKLFSELCPPLLIELQGSQPITRERPRLHFGPDRFLAQLIQRQHSVSQPLDLARVASAPAAVDENDQGVLDHGKQPGLLAILPVGEFG